MFKNNSKTRAGKMAAAAAMSIGLLAGTAGTASAAPPANYAKTHNISASFQFQVHQNNFFHKADASSTKFRESSIAAGTKNMLDLPQTMYAESTAADDTYGSDNLRITEKDANGTLHIRDDQALNFYWHGTAVGSHLDLDIAPNTTRSFWIYTDGAGGDYVHTLVTITNKIA